MEVNDGEFKRLKAWFKLQLEGEDMRRRIEGRPPMTMEDAVDLLLLRRQGNAEGGEGEAT